MLRIHKKTNHLSSGTPVLGNQLAVWHRPASRRRPPAGAASYE